MPAVPADVKLWVFNQALTHLGARKLSSLSEARESRRVLDSCWDAAFIDYVLEQGQWKFATKTISVGINPSVAPAFGFQYAFDKPADLKRLTSMSLDPYFNEPFLAYQDTGPYWFADAETLYVRYVSNDTAYGNDLTRWTATFLHYVALELAKRAAPRIKNDTTADALEAKTRKALHDAQSLDSTNEPTKFPPQGRWLGARTTGSSRRDRTGGWR